MSLGRIASALLLLVSLGCGVYGKPHRTRPGAAEAQESGEQTAPEPVPAADEPQPEPPGTP
jgi:hypothetical protein